MTQEYQQNREVLKLLVRSREDFQKMRKTLDNRIGRKADGEAQNIGERPMLEEDALRVATYADESRKQEEAIEKDMLKILKRFPVYNEYLSKVKGVGPVAAAYIISEIDIFKATTVSKIWQFCGLNPATNYRGKIVKKQIVKGEEVREIVTTDTVIRGDRKVAGFLSPYNSRMKTYLLGVLATSMLRSGAEYRFSVYDTYKLRLEHEEKWKDESAGHRHRAALRKMIKVFLQDVYANWRAIEGLPVRAPYQEEKLGHKHNSVA